MPQVARIAQILPATLQGAMLTCGHAQENHAPRLWRARQRVVIALQRLGQHVIAVDAYAGAPAMQVADEFEVIMLDEDALDAIVDKHQPIGRRWSIHRNGSTTTRSRHPRVPPPRRPTTP